MDTSPTDSQTSAFMVTTNSSHATQYHDGTSLATAAQELAWALIDGKIDRSQHARLDTLFRKNETFRREFIKVIDLHNSLVELFDNRPAKAMEDDLSKLCFE